MEDGPGDESSSHAQGWRDRLGDWPAAVVLTIVGALVLVTGAVLVWLVITTLGALLRTVF